MLPNFVIIGAQKAGTTSLWRYLGEHPAIFVSPLKEPDFFIAERGWRRGLEWYESLFDAGAAAGAAAIGEASPNYTMFPTFAGVPERMSQVIPSARLIYLLRDPIDRMVSSYLHALSRAGETAPPERALLERPHYLDASRYSVQIERFLDRYDRSQLLILLAEDLDRRREATLDRVLSFLGLPEGWRPADLDVRHGAVNTRVPRRWSRKLGALVIRGRIPAFPCLRRVAKTRLGTRAVTAADTALTDDARKRLEDLLRPDVERLRNHLGRDFEGWGLLA